MFQYEEAIKYYDIVMEKDPKFEGGYYNKALSILHLIRRMDRSFKLTLAQKADQSKQLLDKVIG